jgi:uncharacterized protein (DUF983 family)
MKTPSHPVGPGTILARGLRNRCPNCGRAKLFCSLLRIHHRCPECGMILERGDGFFLGPLCLNYGITVFAVVVPVLIAGFAGLFPLELALAAGLACALFLPVLLYRFTWSWWLAIYYLCLPGELHANRPEDCDDLSFDEETRV